MSDRSPFLKFGHTVRVMQTADMIKAGHANKRGTVTKIDGDFCSIRVNDCDGGNGGEELLKRIPISSVMRV